MPTRRTQIVDALVSDIHTKIARIDSANVKRQMVFLNEVNDFPFVTMMVQPETRFHYGAGRKLATLALSLRGYVFDGDSGENIELAENLGIDLETLVINTFAASHCIPGVSDLQVEAAQVSSFRTDEGLMSPYGIADLEVTITYDVDTVL